MTSWQHYDDDWDWAEERLGNGQWMQAFRAKDGREKLHYVYRCANTWVSRNGGAPVPRGHDPREDISFPRKLGPLELECILIEFRNRYSTR